MILGGANTEMSGMWLCYEVLSFHITLLREELGRELLLSSQTGEQIQLLNYRKGISFERLTNFFHLICYVFGNNVILIF